MKLEKFFHWINFHEWQDLKTFPSRAQLHMPQDKLHDLAQNCENSCEIVSKIVKVLLRSSSSKEITTLESNDVKK